MPKQTGRHQAEQYIGEHRAEGYDQFIGVLAHMAMELLFDARQPLHAKVEISSEPSHSGLSKAHHFQQFILQSNREDLRRRS